MNKRIALILCPEFSMSEVASVSEVFMLANKFNQQIANSEEEYFKVEIYNFTSSSQNMPFQAYNFEPGETINSDVFILTGCFNKNPDSLQKQSLHAMLDEANENKKIIVGLNQATLSLAELDIVNNKRIATHWNLSDKFAEKYPQIRVHNDKIFVKDENIYTSCGYSATYDLCIDLVESSLGTMIANQISQHLVLYCRRLAESEQQSHVMQAQLLAEEDKFLKLLSYIENNVSKQLQINTLASQVAMSERNFSRVFLRKFGMTPFRYVEKVRVNKANLLIKSTNLSLKKVMSLCGFRNREHMNRAFCKIFNKSIVGTHGA